MNSTDLKAWRKKYGYSTQESLATALNVTRSIVAKWETTGVVAGYLPLALKHLENQSKKRMKKR